MLRKQAYQHILKMMLDYPQLVRYFPADSGIWITDGVVGFCVEPDVQIFDMDKMTLTEAMHGVIKDAPEMMSQYLLHDTQRLKITGRHLAHIYTLGAIETWIDDSLLSNFFPARDYEYFQCGADGPIFVRLIGAPDYCGFIMPLSQTEGDQ